MAIPVDEIAVTAQEKIRIIVYESQNWFNQENAIFVLDKIKTL